MRFKNQVGNRFGKLVVDKRVGTKCGSPLWQCYCDCGNVTIATTRDLETGHKLSCGCLVKENHTKEHGYSRTRLYRIWKDMRQRCNNPNNHAYHLYGGRGIKICDEWEDFSCFMEWALKTGYSDTLKIDRVNNDGNYEPTNCRWATQKEQMNNVSYNRIIQRGNETHTLAEWSDITGIDRNLIAKRLEKGWSIERALEEKPMLGKNQYTLRRQ